VMFFSLCFLTFHFRENLRKLLVRWSSKFCFYLKVVYSNSLVFSVKKRSHYLSNVYFLLHWFLIHISLLHTWCVCQKCIFWKKNYFPQSLDLFSWPSLNVSWSGVGERDGLFSVESETCRVNRLEIARLRKDIRQCFWDALEFLSEIGFWCRETWEKRSHKITSISRLDGKFVEPDRKLFAFSPEQMSIDACVDFMDLKWVFFSRNHKNVMLFWWSSSLRSEGLWFLHYCWHERDMMFIQRKTMRGLTSDNNRFIWHQCLCECLTFSQESHHEI
jgi:hypothetical protein